MRRPGAVGRADVVLDNAERRATTRQICTAEIPTGIPLLDDAYVRTRRGAGTADLRIGRGFDAEITDFRTEAGDQPKREARIGREAGLEPAVGTGMRARARRLVLVEERQRQLGDRRRE